MTSIMNYTFYRKDDYLRSQNKFELSINQSNYRHVNSTRLNILRDLSFSSHRPERERRTETDWQTDRGHRVMRCDLL